MLQTIRPLVHLALLATLLISGAGARVQAWLMQPASDGTPARVWMVLPVYVAMLWCLIAMAELLAGRARPSPRDWMNQLAQRAAMFFVGAAWVVSWQQLMPTPWTWLGPVLIGVILSAVVARPRSVIVMIVVTLWIGAAMVICARFIPWWTRGMPLYILWEAMAISAWAWLGQVVFARWRLPGAGAIVGHASIWWGNVLPQALEPAPSESRPLATALRP